MANIDFNSTKTQQAILTLARKYPTAWKTQDDFKAIFAEWVKQGKVPASAYDIVVDTPVAPSAPAVSTESAPWDINITKPLVEDYNTIKTWEGSVTDVASDAPIWWGIDLSNPMTRGAIEKWAVRLAPIVVKNAPAIKAAVVWAVKNLPWTARLLLAWAKKVASKFWPAAAAEGIAKSALPAWVKKFLLTDVWKAVWWAWGAAAQWLMSAWETTYDTYSWKQKEGKTFLWDTWLKLAWYFDSILFNAPEIITKSFGKTPFRENTAEEQKKFKEQAKVSEWVKNDPRRQALLKAQWWEDAVANRSMEDTKKQAETLAKYFIEKRKTNPKYTIEQATIDISKWVK